MSEPRHFESGLRGTLRVDEPMAGHVSWRAGGAARRAYIPKDLQDLSEFLKRLEPGEPVLFVGLGSNLLVRDGGFPGTVILMHDIHARPQMDGPEVFAPAGVANPKLARFAANQGLEGGEFLAGIPGTVGGALAMNAGCYGSETWDRVTRVQMIDPHGVLSVRQPEAFQIGYRHCSLRAEAPVAPWFVGAWFGFRPGSSAAARGRIRSLLERRVAAQPINLPNAGSVFRNPPGDYAARLIEACGLKSFSIGGAQVSEKHANFIVNPGRRARAADIEALIELIGRRVLEVHGVQLVPEVRIVGEIDA